MIVASARSLPLLLAIASLLTPGARAEEVSVAVAANFTAPMQEIARLFEQDTGHRAVLSFGATGKFYAQIAQGAPFGILLAADDRTPERIGREGLGDPQTRFTYAIGQLALWSRQPGYVDAEGRVLARNDWQHLAIANPKLAPYGQAAMETLARMGLTEQVQGRVVQGENIAQAYQFVASGNAELGFVALSQVMQGGQLRAGSAWIVPADMHRPIRQDAIVLKGAQANPAAVALMQYLRGERARAVIRAYGYAF